MLQVLSQTLMKCTETLAVVGTLMSQHTHKVSQLETLFDDSHSAACVHVCVACATRPAEKNSQVLSQTSPKNSGTVVVDGTSMYQHSHKVSRLQTLCDDSHLAVRVHACGTHHGLMWQTPKS